MKIKKIKVLLLFTCFLTFITIGFYFLIFDNDISFSKYNNLVSLSKRNIGGIVYNKTSQEIEVTDYKYVSKLPPGKSSRDLGIWDADTLVINKPMYFDNIKYSNKILKFCDYSRLEILEIHGETVIKSKNKWICKLLNDFDFYGNIDEAF